MSLSALPGVTQWIEHWPVNQRVTGLIPIREHAWVAGQVMSAMGGTQEATTH